MAEDGVFAIKGNVRKECPRLLADREIGLVRQNWHHVRRKGVQLNVGCAFAQFEGADDCFGHHTEADALDLWRASEICVVRANNDFFVLLCAEKSERAAADRMLCEIGSRSCGHDSDGGAEQAPGKRRVGFREMENYRLRVRGINRLQQAESAALRALDYARWPGDSIQDGFVGELDVGRSERAAVVKTHACVEMKNVCARVGHFPTVSKIAAKIHGRVALKKPAEQEAVYLLGAGVGAHARIKVGWHCLNEKSYRAGRFSRSVVAAR